MRCQSNARRRKLSSPRLRNLVSKLLIHQVPVGWRLGRFVFITQWNAGHESNHRHSSIYIPSSRRYLHSLFLPYLTHSQHFQLSRHHVTCTKQRLSFQNTRDNLHNIVRSLWACFHYMQLYHNPNASDVDSFSPHSDGTKGQLQRKGEGKCQGKNADICYKSTPVIGSGPYKGIHIRTHPWTHTDIQCLWHQGWEGLGPLLRHNLSWSIHDSPLFTIPADVAAPQEQEFTFSEVVGSLPLIYGANGWQNPQSNEQKEVGQPPCLQGSSQ